MSPGQERQAPLAHAPASCAPAGTCPTSNGCRHHWADSTTILLGRGSLEPMPPGGLGSYSLAEGAEALVRAFSARSSGAETHYRSQRRPVHSTLAARPPKPAVHNTLNTLQGFAGRRADARAHAQSVCVSAYVVPSMLPVLLLLQGPAQSGQFTGGREFILIQCSALWCSRKLMQSALLLCCTICSGPPNSAPELLRRQLTS